MNESLKNLIDAATISGKITDQQKAFILKKAKEVGVDELEAEIYINAGLKKNTVFEAPPAVSSQSIDGSVSVSNPEWISLKDYSAAEWTILISCVFTLVSGFLPWIESSVSSRGFGSSYSGSASVSGGIIYSLPIAIAAVFLGLKSYRSKVKMFLGIGIVAVSIMFAASYSSKSSSSLSGYDISASASTKAGPGVSLLFIAGVLFSIGGALGMVGNKEKINSFCLKFAKVIGAWILVILCYRGINVWSENSIANTRLDDLYIPAISLVLLLALPKIKQTSFIKIPLLTLNIAVILDIFLRSLSFFPSNDVSAVLKEKVGENAGDLEIPNEIYDLSVANPNWFSFYEYRGGESVLGWITALSAQMIDSISYVFVITSLILVLGYVFKTFSIPLIESKVKGLGDRIEAALGDRWKSKGSVNDYVLHWASILMIGLCAIKLTAAFAFNSARYNEISNTVSTFVDQYSAEKKSEMDSIAASHQQADIFKNNVNQLQSSLIGLYASETEVLDSVFVVVVESYKDYYESMQRVDTLKSIGLPADRKEGPYNSALSYSPNFITIGVFPSTQSCITATGLLKNIFPQARGYYLPGGNELVTVEKLLEQQAADSTLNISAPTTSEPLVNTSGTIKVVSERCYFYSAPKEDYRTNAYLIRGETTKFIDRQNDFVYVEFVNSRGQTTKGWLRILDVVVI